MSLTPRLTLIGLYNYDPAVFINLTLPAAVDEEIFIDSLLMEYGECPLIYPDLDFMKLAIGAWSRKWYANIERIAAAITEEYNPLHNYDRTETWTENEEGNKDFTRGIVDGESATENQTINESGNITESESGTENTKESENGNDENLISAYNENDYQPSTKTTYERENERETETEKDKTTATTKATTANKTNRNDRSTDETYGETNGRQNTKSGRAFGNIGVTESTTMLQHELDIRRTENLYHIIAELFYKEFCLYVF